MSPKNPDVPRRRLPAAERKALILADATQLFARHGFEGTTTAELARRAGISEGFLLKLFGSKRALYGELINHKIEEIGDAIFARDAARKRDDRAFFYTVAWEVLHRAEEDPAFIRILLYSALEGHEFAQMFYEVRISKLIDNVAAYIRRRVRDKEFRSVDPEIAAISFFGMTFQHVLVRHVFRPPNQSSMSLDQVANLVADLTLTGLKR